MPLVTVVQRYVSTKLDVSTALLFGENGKHGTDGWTDRQTDGQTNGVQEKQRNTQCGLLMRGPHIKSLTATNRDSASTVHLHIFCILIHHAVLSLCTQYRKLLFIRVKRVVCRHNFGYF